MYCICCLVILIIPGIFASMNIAKGKRATQSSDYNSRWGAEKAVDGVTYRSGIDRDVDCNCCSHTRDISRTAWWQVDLEKPSRIQSVKIFYRKNFLDRFAGFSLYLDNTTGRREQLCYKHSGVDLPDSIQNNNCPFTARYVFIYNERLSSQVYPANYSSAAVLELCEVEVYGCPLLKYGLTCTANCSIGCNAVSYVCEPDTGDCTFGCKTGFRGLRCDECENGYYGYTCTPCSSGCALRSCKQDNGYCNLGCQGSLCGDFCNITCPVICENNRCDQNTGVQTDNLGLIIGGFVSVSMINIVFLAIVYWKRLRNENKRLDQSSQTTGLPEGGRQQHDNHNLEQQQAVEYETLELEGCEQQQTADYEKLELDCR